MWAFGGVEDFYIAFDISDRFRRYVAFFYHQGLEKICKAYLLGTMAPEYESKTEQEARMKVNELATGMGHKLEEMINTLVNCQVLDKSILEKSYGDFDGKAITGEKCIEILKRAYLECRYPVPKSVYENYPLSNKKGKAIGGYWDPVASSEIREFAYEVALRLIKKIEEGFNVSIPRYNFSTAIKDEDWIRFRRFFFKDNI